MDHCWAKNGHFRLILLYLYTFYSHYNMDWMANTEIGLDPNNSVIKRLRYITIKIYIYVCNRTQSCVPEQSPRVPKSKCQP